MKAPEGYLLILTLFLSTFFFPVVVVYFLQVRERERESSLSKKFLRSDIFPGFNPISDIRDHRDLAANPSGNPISLLTQMARALHRIRK